MTAQPSGVGHVKAYAFVMFYGKEQRHTEVVAIATTVQEAETKVKLRYTTDLHGDATFFNTGVAVMQPAMIEWWDEPSRKRVEEKGYYAFLKGMFFCHCASRHGVSHCKQVQTRTGWTAVIYGGDYEIKPL
jgi:hypothetical protein